MNSTILHGDALAHLRTLGDNSIDAIVTDPPYGLGEIKDLSGLLAAWMRGEDGAEHQTKGFMSKAWDIVPPPVVWAEALRVLKPGGHLLAFAGTRTWDVMSLSIRLAGFELRDSIDNEVQAFRWLYGSGFPKSQDIGKAIDRAAGAEREVIGENPYASRRPNPMKGNSYNYNASGYDISQDLNITAPATPEAQQWDGWGTALKPAWEPVLIFRKPISEKTIAANVLRWGTGGINVNGARVATDKPIPAHHSTGKGVAMAGNVAENWGQPYQSGDAEKITQMQGRWPANVLLSHLETCTEDVCADMCVVRELGEQSGQRKSAYSSDEAARAYAGKYVPRMQETRQTYGDGWKDETSLSYADTGTAARYFAQFRYQAKASKAERDLGCEDLPIHNAAEMVDRTEDTPGMDSPRAGAGRTGGARNHHPTIKPLQLMRYLVKLVTPPGGIILDPFAGSGTTGMAAILEGAGCILIEREAEYIPIIEARLAWAANQGNEEKAEMARKSQPKEPKPTIVDDAPAPTNTAPAQASAPIAEEKAHAGANKKHTPTAAEMIAASVPANSKPEKPKANRAPRGKQGKCDHLRYKPYASQENRYGKKYEDVTPEEWERASAFVDLAMTGANGRQYQRCIKCSLKRYKPGQEMKADPVPMQKAEPPKAQGSLFDLATVDTGKKVTGGWG